MIISLVALLSATLFTGAAFYITLVEHPARLGLGDGPMLQQWQPSYKRALPIQSGLAVIGGLAGLIAGYLTKDWLWVAGSVALLANWPFTLLAIFPVNKRLMALNPRLAGFESRAMLVQWGRLHGVRSFLGAAAMLFFALPFMR
ncbi:hypothetical protein L288_00340 [Sphingobium quisquiliarum P25]|uniref:DUF1772 domain-containing protein n=1 Tax=Sphingobium quisquiliarum P25 TaxID=1329909 RepID=T0IZ98_9SPHN|nr:anthrone oxygenase family protein [Sphingobium quisquiliarum]EQB15014.1 hypothetical protein L288_00340 [Sphingobium quisquiliarum P25]